MPRLPSRVVSRMQPASSKGSRLTANEVAAVTKADAKQVAKQAVDVLENGAALAKLRALLGSDPVPAPLSSLSDLPAGQAWLAGTLKIGPGSGSESVRVLQRALMKIGAHHPQGRSDPSLLLLPYGADGSLGPGTLKAVDAALRLAGRADLTPASAHLPLGAAVAHALETLLQATPHIGAATPTPPPSTSVPQRLNLLGGVALAAPQLPYDARWQGVLARIDAEKGRYHDGAAGNSAAQNAWIRQVDALRGKPEREQLERVNQLVNALPYAWDDSDTWQTPLEFVAHRGDCEDFAIAKYESLRHLGVDPSRMRLLIVRDTLTRQAHALLAVDMPDATYILDNQSTQVLKNEDVKLPDGRFLYEPIAMLSRDKGWIFGFQR